ncbi:PIG-L deacetylase family protein [Symbiobacterium thermophilum]|uniref:PIG-L family deacetylase n=1 Tax=Symbiobacterium thermophilum TaxID=2734 RepID=A0A953I7L4_SYMTR|nr:PIG-L deacetylase family protein [Symbiobacterium thermophilum]MBY6275938.1 PIG-L family deacetylase [Symbiobacterium thermophilum]
MPEHAEARPDRTLAVKRRLFSGLYRFGSLRWVEWMAACLVAPDHPELARAQGELLVSTPRRVLAFTAHPDDLEFFCGGTLRRMALAGSRITAVVLTDGEKRGNWRDLAEQRQAEQWQAARLQGYEAVHFLGLPDFGLAEDPRLERLLARAWDHAGPEVVLAFDPKELVPQMAHRDHKALGRAVMDLARSRAVSGAQVYFYGTRHPDVLVDISPVIDDKVRAVRAHRSQMVYLDEAETDGAVRLMARIMAGRSGVAYAEGLFRLL